MHFNSKSTSTFEDDNIKVQLSIMINNMYELKNFIRNYWPWFDDHELFSLTLLS